jgi:hypothetical protein
MGSLPEDFEDWRPLAPKVLRSPLLKKVRRLKRELIAQLFIRQGEFWDAVSDMRTRWNVRAQRRLPELSAFVVWPDRISEEERSGWLGDLIAIKDKTIPQNMRKRSHYSWRQFLAACVLYDPPDLELMEFASYADPRPERLFPIKAGKAEPLPTPEEIVERAKTAGVHAFHRFAEQLESGPQESKANASARDRRTPVMCLPPIVKLRNPYEVEEVAMWFLTQTVREFIERYIRPQGLDVEAVLHNVLEASGLWEEYWDRMDQVSETYYILVDEYTTEEDLESARRMIRATQEPNPGGRPPRDTLVALQCALLHDKYNYTDPTDRRFKRWTYRRLAERFSEFGVSNERSAEEYTKLGRQLLKHRPT